MAVKENKINRLQKFIIKPHLLLCNIHMQSLVVIMPVRLKRISIFLCGIFFLENSLQLFDYFGRTLKQVSYLIDGAA